MAAKKFGSAYKDMSNQDFGRLTVLRDLGRDRHGNVTWLCRCACGREISVIGHSLRAGSTRSCGCSTAEIRRERFADRRRKTGARGTGFRTLFNSYKHGAKRRGLTWSLTEDEVAITCQKPCTYCGTKLNSVSSPGRTPWAYTGIDRIDNTRGYESDNITPCCKGCNEMKMDKRVEVFLESIARIYKHSIAPQSLKADHG